ncbi:MAG: amino acid ABC transporter permease [Neisseriaceae bacterium]|nr:amino acid ABC transporter permease [Neisseriaceae bacterium]
MYNWDWGVYFHLTGMVQGEQYWEWFVSGLSITIQVGTMGWILALGIGIILGIFRTLSNPFLSGLASAYVNVFRNIPLLIQLFFWYYVLPEYLPESVQIWWKQDLSPSTSALVSLTIGLGMFTAARICEQVRTGIQALSSAQAMAAKALGLRPMQIYRLILLPQAFRIIMPPLTSEFLNIFKNASVGALIGVMELVNQTQQASTFTEQFFECLTLATAMYFILNSLLMRLMSWIEKKTRIKGMIGDVK